MEIKAIIVARNLDISSKMAFAFDRRIVTLVIVIYYFSLACMKFVRFIAMSV